MIYGALEFTCPITVAIDEIKIADEDQGLVKIGGLEYMYDNVAYKIATDKIEVARFVARNTRNSTEQVKEAGIKVGERLFASIAGMDYIDAYSALFNEIMVNTDLLGDQIKRFCATAALFDKEVDIVQYVDYVASRRPDVLLHQVSIFREFASAICENVPEMPNIAPVAFPENRDIPDTTSYETIEGIQTLLEHKLVILNYLLAVEEIHCSVINYLNVLTMILVKKLDESD
jgi:hypothetical protein